MPWYSAATVPPLISSLSYFHFLFSHLPLIQQIAKVPAQRWLGKLLAAEIKLGAF